MQTPSYLEHTHILIVDDDCWIRSALAYYFNKKARFCIAVETAERALELFTQQPFHVMLCDHRLPGTCGLDVLETAGHLRPDMFRVLITAYASDEIRHAAHAIGVDDIIEKPFSTRDIRCCLDKLLGHARQ
jgi:two-component system, NtrC family, response regulator